MRFSQNSSPVYSVFGRGMGGMRWDGTGGGGERGGREGMGWTYGWIDVGGCGSMDGWMGLQGLSAHRSRPSHRWAAWGSHN